MTRAGSADLPAGRDDVFVVQEHHARSLHWDVRFERDGVLVSWAVPKGLPDTPGPIRLAVRTEDHPLEYAAFEGDIPRGEYGAGRMVIWDRGRYEVRKWQDTEVDVVLHGARIDGRYVFFQPGRSHKPATHSGTADTDHDTTDSHPPGTSAATDRADKNWMVRRSSPAADPAREPIPEDLRPMLATAGSLPPAAVDADWAYEFKWDGIRALVTVDGGRVRIHSRSGRDVTAEYPELQALGGELGGVTVLLDGELVVFERGRPSFAALQQRLQLTGDARVRRAAREHPVTFLVFDVIWLDGRSCAELPYTDRRRLLDGLGLRGAAWQTPPSFTGGGESVLRVAREQHLEGVLAKRLSSRYLPGRRSTDWIKIADLRTVEVVIGGWAPGTGSREGLLGGLLLGLPSTGGLRYVGRVGTGFTTAALRELTARLRRLDRARSPFAGDVPVDRARGVHWVRPSLVGEVVFQDWTPDGRLRAPRWRGLRPDRDPAELSDAVLTDSLTERETAGPEVADDQP